MRPFRRDHFADRRGDRFVAGHVEGQHLERSLACLRSTPAGAVDLVAGRGEPRAVASPMPDEAPVTRAILLWS